MSKMTPERFPRLFALALVATLAGSCRAQAPASDDPELNAAMAQLEAHKRELAGLRGANACPQVCRLSGLICAASSRICEIASRHSSEPGYAEKCRGANSDCQSAASQCDGCR